MTGFPLRSFRSGRRRPRNKSSSCGTGLGVAMLPCFVGDADTMLVGVPGTARQMLETLWLLTRDKTRKTKRLRSSPSSQAEPRRYPPHFLRG